MNIIFIHQNQIIQLVYIHLHHQVVKGGNIKIAKDSITYVTSGLFDRNKGTCLSYLHKAIKALKSIKND